MSKTIKVIKKTKLTESADKMKELDEKALALGLYTEYINYLKKMIEQEEDALKNCDDERVRASIQRRLNDLNSDLEAALPDAVKDKATEATAEKEITVEGIPTEKVAAEETTEKRDDFDD